MNFVCSDAVWRASLDSQRFRRVCANDLQFRVNAARDDFALTVSLPECKVPHFFFCILVSHS